MSTEVLVTLALEKLGCNQTELARRLDVTRAQITKWKGGEGISTDNEVKIRNLIGLSKNDDPELVQITGGVEQARKWERLIEYLANQAEENSETGYYTHHLQMELGVSFLTWNILKTMISAGVEIPKTFPESLDFDIEDSLNTDDNSVWEEVWRIIDEDPYSRLIQNCF